MIWSKMKQQLEGFLAPALAGRVEYRPAGYRYLPEKPGRCYLGVDRKAVLDMRDDTTGIRWYGNEQDVRNDPDIRMPVSGEELAAAGKAAGGKVPPERVEVMVRNRKMAAHAKEMLAAQAALSKSDFQAAAGRFLTGPIEESLESGDILLNILALVDRRVGKKRLSDMEDRMRLKHPAVRWFYELRRSAM
ncbi:SF0329 family protein [Anaerotalea alkaliphila]|uniref:Uncharacterized protein n=1 Tax=Anaerotalea alkaliphila TaxID=2662126 RepID=A0A7X5HTW3_9FIRM|nr:hypothetical protein [Anaerotalea alkaliphila]NDL66576.1 hypothetical protein [Anaerotalea alkaliphila]